MSDANIKIGVNWADFPPGSSYVFKDQYQKLTNQVGSQVSAINAAQNGLDELKGAVDAQGNKLNEEIANQNQNIEQLGQNQQNLAEQVGQAVTSTSFATIDTGGVVLLSEKINQLTPIALTASPAAYDQADDQANRTAIQTAINGIITSINDLIAKQQAAKQMEQ